MNKAALFFIVLFVGQMLFSVRKKSCPWKRDFKTGRFLNLQRRRQQLLTVDVCSQLQPGYHAGKATYPCNQKTPFGRNIARMHRGMQQIKTVLWQMNHGRDRLHQNVYCLRPLFLKIELQQAWVDTWEWYRTGLLNGYDAGGYSFMKFYSDQVEAVPEWIKEMEKIKHDIDHVIPEDGDLDL